MPCFHPLLSWRGEVSRETGKRSVVFKASEASPGLSILSDKLPCGQCIGCRLDYALDWSVRCVCEAQMHDRNCFITLTYEKMPKDDSLQLLDWQLFMKRVRKRFGPVRHFHAGEYGTLNGRPHDHALLFGIDFDDRVLNRVTGAGSNLYTSDVLTNLWGKGFCSVGNASFESAGYLARYLIGKPTLTHQVKDEYGVVIGRSFTDKAILKYGEKIDEVTGEVSLLRRPEYLTMSRDYGIGRSWLDKYCSDVYPRDYVLVRDNVKMPPPRAFDNWYELKNPVDMARIKCDRIARCQTKEEVWNKFLEKFQLLDCARDERLNVREIIQVARFGFLKEAL